MKQFKESEVGVSFTVCRGSGQLGVRGSDWLPDWLPDWLVGKSGGGEGVGGLLSGDHR